MNIVNALPFTEKCHGLKFNFVDFPMIALVPCVSTVGHVLSLVSCSSLGDTLFYTVCSLDDTALQCTFVTAYQYSQCGMHNHTCTPGSVFEACPLFFLKLGIFNIHNQHDVCIYDDKTNFDF